MREQMKSLDELEMEQELWPDVRRRVPRSEPPPEPGPSTSARVVAGAVAIMVAVGGFALLRSAFSTQPAPTGTPIAVSNGAIAFERRVDGGEGGSHLWLVMPDGTDERQLTFGEDGVFDRWPAWSSDGTRIAFVRLDYPGNSFGLWTTDVSGSEPRMVTPPGLGAARSDWSPDVPGSSSSG